jgi:enterochelin esterase-like enzyme
MHEGATLTPAYVINPEESPNLTSASGTVEPTVTSQASTSAWDRWRYAGGRRDLRLDAIRGLAVLVMIVDHLGGQQSWLYLLTGHDRFFISAAEPFIFVSGLVMGLVYSRIIAAQGTVAAVKKALKRAAVLYALTVGVSLASALLSLQLNLPWEPHWSQGGMGDFILSIVTFQRAYYLTDVLLLYTLLVLVAAPLLVLLARGYGWLVLTASWGLWATWQLSPQPFDFPWQITDNGIFHFSSWQVLFYSALVIGYYHSALQRTGSRLWAKAFRGRLSRRAYFSILLTSTALIIAGSIAAYLWIQSTPGSVDDLAAARFFEKAGLRAGRLVVFALFILFAFTLLTVMWRPIKRALGWLLLPLGRHALAAFIMHLFLVTIFAKVFPRIASLFGATWDPDDPALATLVQLLGIALIWLAVQVLPRIWARATKAVKALASYHPAPKISPSATRSPLALRAGTIVILLVALFITSSLALLALTQSDVLAQTLQALDDKGKNTIVMMSTTTARVPSLPTSTPAPQKVLATITSIAASSPIITEPTATTPASSLDYSPAPTSPTMETPTPTPTVANAAPAQESPTLLPNPTKIATSPVAIQKSPTPLSTSTPTSTPSVRIGMATIVPSPIPTTFISPGVEVHNFTSATLGREMPYLIYLPPDYYTAPDKRYPVLYMLHGIGAWYGEWAQLGLLSRADEAIRAGQIEPFVIVLPQGDQSYWMDHANGGPRWGTYLVQDVVGEIDSHFRTIADRDHRAVGGLSMGAHAALQLSINYPDIFGIAGAHSPSLYPRERLPSFFGDDAHYRAHDPVQTYAASPEIARTLKIWIDLGENDPWLSVITSFHGQLQSDGIPHEWNVYPGEHAGQYWAVHVVDYLSFYNRAFGKAVSSAPGANVR